MKKKFLKISIILLALLSLTGCDFIYKTNKAGLFGITFFEYLIQPETFAQWIYVPVIQVINEFFATTQGHLFESATNSTKIVSDYLGSISNFNVIVKTASILSVVAIVIFFAWSVFKTNMFEQNKDMAPDMVTRIKKIIVAIAITYALPYIAITGFTAASTLGSQVSAIIMKDAGISTYKYKIYEEMSRNGLSYGTYCAVGQQNSKRAGDLTKLKGYGNKSVQIITVDEAENYKLSDDFLTVFPEYKDVDLYDFWCGGVDGSVRDKSLNIYTSLFVEGQPFDDVALFNATLADIIEIIVDSLFMIFCLFVAAFVSISTATRVVELIFLIATSWWYIGHSVDDLSNRSMSSIWRKLITICLTQFFLMIEIGIFISLCSSGFIEEDFLSTLMKISMIVACGLVAVGTPDAIKELVQDTGLAPTAIASITKHM